MKIKPILLFLLTLSSSSATAEDMRWSIKGFGTLALTGTDTDTIGFRRANTQTQDVTDSWGLTTDSRIGAQVSVDINRSWRATVQWVARDHAGNFFEQNLDWAFLRWKVNQNFDIRAGRLAVDLFLLSDYRDVGYAYPWMRPPHEFYNNQALHHFDGADLNYKIYFDDDLLSIKIFAGYSMNQVPSPTVKSINVDAPLVGASLKFNSGNWTTQAGYSYLQVANELPTEQLVAAMNSPAVNFGIPNISQLTPCISLKGSNVHYYSLGAAFDNGSWLTQAEISYVNTDTHYFPESVSAYLSIGKRISKVTLYSLFGISRSFQNDVNVPSPIVQSPQLQRIYQEVNTTINKNGIDEKSVSLGARWDFHPKFALKTQWSHYWLGKNGTQFWQDVTPKDQSRQVNVWSVGIDFIF